jgi:chemotaxis protein methyltransferase CheR
MGELGLTSLDDYLTHLEAHPTELGVLHGILSITVSRFFRDREEWIRLRRHLPELARVGGLRAWSVGCASGEEPYTLSILWKLWSKGVRAQKGTLDILATDISSTCLERARRRIYPEGAVHSAPPEALRGYFRRGGSGLYELDRRIASTVAFKRLDLLGDPWPEGPFDLILCRNLVFTYLEEPVRSEVARRLLDRVRPGGFLMVGSNERPPQGVSPRLRHVEGCLWGLPEGSTEGRAEGPEEEGVP